MNWTWESRVIRCCGQYALLAKRLSETKETIYGLGAFRTFDHSSASLLVSLTWVLCCRCNYRLSSLGWLKYISNEQNKWKAQHSDAGDLSDDRTRMDGAYWYGSYVNTRWLASRRMRSIVYCHFEPIYLQFLPYLPILTLETRATWHWDGCALDVGLEDWSTRRVTLVV